MSAERELIAVFRAEVEEQLDTLFELLSAPPEAWNIEALFRVAHTIKGSARVVGADALQATAHRLEDLFSALRRGAPRSETLAALARRGCELLQATFADNEGTTPGRETFHGDVLAALEATAEGSAAPNRRKTGSRGARMRGRGPGPVEVAPASAQAPTPTPDPAAVEPGADTAAAETVRIHVAKLDALMPLAAETATARQGNEALQQRASRLQTLVDDISRRHAALSANAEFGELRQELRRLRDDLGRQRASEDRLAAAVADGVRGLRLVPIENLGRLLGRALRDACAQAGREARLEIRGGATEVDRGVLDALRDPLVHLVRNAVAHGVEPAEERRAAGKAPQATVGVEARSNGSFVDIEVWDDGRGIDWLALRAAAAAEGRPEASEQDLVAMLFRPGFSTRSEADALSGRGVGLDVVRHAVEALGGEVTLDSAVGGGAHFRLRLPLTRLTTRGLQVRLGRHEYILPMGAVESTQVVAEEDLRVAEGVDVVLVGTRPLPVVELGGLLAIERARRGGGAGIVIGDGQRRRVVLVDEVIGEQEVVLQPLCWNLRSLRWVSGYTVLHGDTLVPVLDPAQLLGATLAKGVEAGRQPGARTRKRLLVVDDSVTSRTLQKNILSAAGYEVEVAVDGQKAWDRLQRGSIDMLISDVEMPLLDGIELATRVRASRELGRLPVVLVTSLGDEEHRQRGAQAGADAYIVKGEFDQDQLLKAVARLL